MGICSVSNGRMITMKSTRTGKWNWSLSSKVIKIEQREALSLARTDDPKVT